MAEACTFGRTMIRGSPLQWTTDGWHRTCITETDMKKRPFLASFIFGLGVTTAVFLFPAHWNSNRQPIAYDHSIHIQNGLTCPDCHPGVKDRVHAELPSLDACRSCHEDLQGKTEEEKKVVAHVKSSTPIPWRQVHRLPADLFFSHRRHVTVAALECSRCHGDVEHRTKPFEKPVVKLSMDFCLNCHYRSGLKRDCSSCHR
jgi:Cytochrome c7 and related cytochrome c/Class III cytochrome C family